MRSHPGCNTHAHVVANARKAPNRPMPLRRKFDLTSVRHPTNETIQPIQHSTRRSPHPCSAGAAHRSASDNANSPNRHAVCPRLLLFSSPRCALQRAFQLHCPLCVVHYAGAGTSSSLPLPIVNPLVPSGPLGPRRRRPSTRGAPGALGAALELTNLGGCALLTGLAAAQDA